VRDGFTADVATCSGLDTGADSQTCTPVCQILAHLRASFVRLRTIGELPPGVLRFWKYPSFGVLAARLRSSRHKGAASDIEATTLGRHAPKDIFSRCVGEALPVHITRPRKMYIHVRFSTICRRAQGAGRVG
jgi:hypothetical protein